MISTEFIDFIENSPDKDYELIDGEVKAMSTSALHGALVGMIMGQLYNILTGSTCLVMPETFTIYIDEKNNYAPDISVVCSSSEHRKGMIYTIIPELAIEVLSPSNDKDEIDKKIKGYYKRGVKELWIIYNEYYSEIYYWTESGYRKVSIHMNDEDRLILPVNRWKKDSEIVIHLSDIPEIWRTNPIYRYNIWSIKEKDQ